MTERAVPPTVLIVDDHEVVRQGIRRSCERAGGEVEVVGEAATVAEARRLIASLRPDVAVVDVVLPDGDGIQLCREINAQWPATACVLLTSFPEPRAKLSAALAGAAAYLAKDGSAGDLVETLRVAASGEELLDSSEISSLLDDLVDRPSEHQRLARLTPQEWRVFELIGQGLSNRQVAQRLHLSERTIKNYASRVLSKLDMDRRTEAAVLAARMAERRAQRRARREDGPHAPE